jgi:uncharacterized protein
VSLVSAWGIGTTTAASKTVTSSDDSRIGASALRVALVAQVVAFIAAGAIGLAFLVDHATGEVKPGPWPNVVGLIPLWIVLGGAAIFLARRSGWSLFGTPFFRWADIAWFPVGIVSQFVVGLLYLPFNVDKAKVEKPAKELIGSASRGSVGFLVLAVCIVVGAPLIEELFYRGVVWRGSKHALSGKRLWAVRVILPIVISGIWFGAIHFQPLLFPILALIGAMAAYIASRESRILPAVFFHAGFNLVTVIALGSSLPSK